MPRFLIILSIVMFTFGPTTPSIAQTAIGTAEQVETSVRGRGSRAIIRNASIFANERVRTNRTGLGHFRFTDGTKMVIGPGSSLVLDELVFRPNGSTFDRFVLRSSRGATRIITGSSKSSAFRVTTPVGAIGLRGTAFDIRHSRGRTYVMVLAGSVEVCNRRNRCQNLSRKCSYVEINRLGRVSQPVLPRQGNLSAREMARLFPFVNDEQQLREEYRLGSATCAGGRAIRERTQRIRLFDTDPGSEPEVDVDNDAHDTGSETPSTTNGAAPAGPTTTDTPGTTSTTEPSTPVTSPVDVPIPDVATKSADADASGSISGNSDNATP